MCPASPRNRSSDAPAAGAPDGTAPAPLHPHLSSPLLELVLLLSSRPSPWRLGRSAVLARPLVRSARRVTHHRDGSTRLTTAPAPLAAPDGTGRVTSSGDVTRRVTSPSAEGEAGASTDEGINGRRWGRGHWTEWHRLNVPLPRLSPVRKGTGSRAPSSVRNGQTVRKSMDDRILEDTCMPLP